MNTKIEDITGHRFGRLVVVELLDKRERRQSVWKCQCDCGNIIEVPKGRLRSSNTQSCGCIWKENNRLAYGESSAKKLLRMYRINARERGFEFNIPLDDFLHLISLDCFYCGASPKKVFRIKGGYGEIKYNGLDRVDVSKGYDLDNVVSCCENCNYAKRKMSYMEFKDWIYRIADHMLSKEILYATARS